MQVTTRWPTERRTSMMQWAMALKNEQIGQLFAIAGATGDSVDLDQLPDDVLDKMEAFVAPIAQQMVAHPSVQQMMAQPATAASSVLGTDSVSNSEPMIDDGNKTTGPVAPTASTSPLQQPAPVKMDMDPIPSPAAAAADTPVVVVSLAVKPDQEEVKRVATAPPPIAVIVHESVIQATSSVAKMSDDTKPEESAKLAIGQQTTVIQTTVTKTKKVPAYARMEHVKISKQRAPLYI